MNRQSNENYEIIEVCLLAGKIMLQSGGETYRVEDTMMRIAASYGTKQSHSYVTPTGIIFAIDGSEPTTRLIRISERSTDMQKITLVNGISRTIGTGKLSVTEAYKMLKEIDSANLTYPIIIQIAAAAIASGCFLIMLQGGWRDLIPALIIGGLGFYFMMSFNRLIPIKFFSEFLASIICGTLSIVFVKYGLGYDLDKIIIGSIIPLVPGLQITNAVRDLMSGHLLSGISKGAEAFLTAFAIGAGIAFVFSFN